MSNTIVVGLGYGDEGKGSVVDYLVRKNNIKTVVRFNGASQALHHVITPEGLFHGFSQFGSGTFVPGVETFISQHMLIDPFSMIEENSVLEEKGIFDAFDRLVIDKKCFIITPFHQIINRMLEVSRGVNRHGSCGKGVGQAVLDSKNLEDAMLRVEDLFDKATVLKKINFLWRLKVDIAEQIIDEHPNNLELLPYLADIKNTNRIIWTTEAYHGFSHYTQIKDHDYLSELINTEKVIFEGAQGALLDATRGFLPHVTKTCTTLDNAESLIKTSGYSGGVKKIGILRAYSTRHGAGPFVAEDLNLTKKIPEYHNTAGKWQGDFRIGWFDLLTAKYALRIVGGVDGIALTNLDRLKKFNTINVCTEYKYVGSDDACLDQFFEIADKQVIKEIKVPVVTTREHQMKLTSLLHNCKPVYQKIDRNCFVGFLEKELNTPISIISYGPKANDKIENN